MLTSHRRYGINSMIYRARRPFNPVKLKEALADNFIIRMSHYYDDEEEEEDDEDEEDDSEDEDEDGAAEEAYNAIRDSSDESQDEGWEDESDGGLDKDALRARNITIVANKAKHPLLSNLYRSKGSFWLASRPDRIGSWSSAGAMLTIEGNGDFFSAMDDDSWEQTYDPEGVALIKADFQGKWGDRRQEIVFIGQGLDTEGLTRLFDSCLLDDEEWTAWQTIVEKHDPIITEARKELKANLKQVGMQIVQMELHQKGWDKIKRRKEAVKLKKLQEKGQKVHEVFEEKENSMREELEKRWNDKHWAKWPSELERNGGFILPDDFAGTSDHAGHNHRR